MKMKIHSKNNHMVVDSDSSFARLTSTTSVPINNEVLENANIYNTQTTLTQTHVWHILRRKKHAYIYI